MATHAGECFCGTVRVEASGDPEGMGYCHCRSCRSWSGGPVNAFTLWKPEAVRVTAGAEHVGMFQKTPVSQRQYCKKCGGHLMTNHPPLGLVDVFAATLPTLKFTPGVHVNYAETVLPMRDGLPKFKDFPAEFGGSGAQVADKEFRFPPAIPVGSETAADATRATDSGADTRPRNRALDIGVNGAGSPPCGMPVSVVRSVQPPAIAALMARRATPTVRRACGASRWWRQCRARRRRRR